MDQVLTALEGWIHFWERIKDSPEWKDGTISRREKQYLYKAEIARQNNRLGSRRIMHLLDKYAPGKYELNEFFIFRG